MQPPSGGCVLKRRRYVRRRFVRAAAFGRLCVETIANKKARATRWQPPSGGCVLKPAPIVLPTAARGAAAFGRLCVET